MAIAARSWAAFNPTKGQSLRTDIPIDRPFPAAGQIRPCCADVRPAGCGCTRRPIGAALSGGAQAHRRGVDVQGPGAAEPLHPGGRVGGVSDQGPAVVHGVSGAGDRGSGAGCHPGMAVSGAAEGAGTHGVHSTALATTWRRRATRPVRGRSRMRRWCGCRLQTHQATMPPSNLPPSQAMFRYVHSRSIAPKFRDSRGCRATTPAAKPGPAGVPIPASPDKLLTSPPRSAGRFPLPLPRLSGRPGVPPGR